MGEEFEELDCNVASVKIEMNPGHSSIDIETFNPNSPITFERVKFKKAMPTKELWADNAQNLKAIIYRLIKEETTRKLNHQSGQ